MPALITCKGPGRSAAAHDVASQPLPPVGRAAMRLPSGGLTMAEPDFVSKGGLPWRQRDGHRRWLEQQADALLG
ncbi:hypothetical protein DRY87_26020, partial [Salmonella enterica subsp. enterica serovar Newport]|nr:hypothetical protein [Salmonella enterica subsp. enterica serovar Newport]